MEEGADIEELIVIRHGEPDHLINNLTGGWTDSHLTELGQKQALLTGQCLSELIGDRPFGFYASDLSRAIETAELIAKSLPIKPALAPGLRELNNGIAADMPNDEAAKIAHPITDPLVDWVPYPNAENWRQMSERVVGFLESIKDSHGLAVLVMHGGSANAAICWWLGLGIGQTNIAFELDPCSISRFNVNRWKERNIVKINDTAHL
ncbi:MAG: histidine phosphatase family protein [Armatimonadetes bacterium]|jgi:probable phosphoglycerate mutase|nr:histidine phosphatase family protein [Armatimonadota bacterium]